jgi:hypothetical protein
MNKCSWSSSQRACSLVVFLLFGVAGMAWSQEMLTALDGNWFAEFSAPNGSPRAAELTISGGSGSWKDFARAGQAKNNPCIGPKYPVALKLRSADEIGIHVDEEKLTGCGDIYARLKLVGDKTLEGTFADGRPLRFTRR